MNRYIVILSIIYIFTSCASILNKNEMDIHIYTNTPTQIVYQSDTINTDKSDELNTAILTVPRSKSPVQFTLINDSIKKDTSIPSRSDFLFYTNILIPPGFLIDLTNSRRYSYKNVLLFDDDLSFSYLSHRKPDETEIQIENHLKQIKKGQVKPIDWFSREKGDIYLNFALPFIYPAHTLIKPNNNSYTGGGSVLGFAGGLDYYYKKDRFINLTASVTAGGDIRMGCGGEWDYEDTKQYNSYNISVSHNHRSRRFSFGYGITHTYSDWWKKEYTDIGDPEHIEQNNTDAYYHYSIPYTYKYNSNKYATLGFVFNGYLYFANFFAFGIIYKPTFVRLNSIMNQKLCYEHQISFDLAFKIRLNKRKNKTK